MVNDVNLDPLVDEYRTLVEECTDEGGEIDWSALKDRLMADGEWTVRGADHLSQIVQEYGTFVLRNAAALAIATRIEDGNLGL